MRQIMEELEQLQQIYNQSDHGFALVKTVKIKEPPPLPLLKFKKGERVMVYNRMSSESFAEDHFGVIIKVMKRYDGKTGKPFNIYMTQTGQLFDGRGGGPLTSPLAYGIRKIKEGE